jgi:hypothetical protein
MLLTLKKVNMKHYLVEHWSYKPTWLALSQTERVSFFEQIGSAIEQMASAGIRTLGFGQVQAVAHAPTQFGFWAIWEAESASGIDALLEGVAQSGWYTYFSQQNTTGALSPPENVIGMLIHAK